MGAHAEQLPYPRLDAALGAELIVQGLPGTWPHLVRAWYFSDVSGATIGAGLGLRRSGVYGELAAIQGYLLAALRERGLAVPMWPGRPIRPTSLSGRGRSARAGAFV